MPRKARAEFEPGIHHVFARANNRELLFVDDRDRDMYLALVAQVGGHLGWRSLAYCLMHTHVHLLIETTVPNLSIGMRRIHTAYVQAFNRRHGRRGHLIENRFGSVRVEDDAQFWMVVGYIARNPVEAQLCRRPEEWRWSSYPGVANGAAPAWLDIDRLLELIAASGGDPMARYLECVDPHGGADEDGERTTAAARSRRERAKRTGKRRKKKRARNRPRAP